MSRVLMISTELSAEQQSSGQLPGFPVELACPTCRRPVRWEGDVGRCASCGPVGVLRGGRVPDFLDSDKRSSQLIWEWPDDFADGLATALFEARDGAAVPSDRAAELRSLGLLDEMSNLTALGDNVCYHLGEYRVQERPEQFVHPRFLETLNANSKVLDIGCGAGQSLRRLDSFGPPERVGVDIDLDALALSRCFRERESQDIHLVRGSGCALPFPNKQFTHVFCRVALALMQQRRTLAEMVRVLQPGGYLYCHVEGPGFGLARVFHRGSVKQFLCRLRDFFLG